MSGGCVGAGILALAYFALVYLYTGGTVTFGWFWVLLAGVFFLFALLFRLSANTHGVGIALFRFFLHFLLVGSLAIMMYFGGRILRAANASYPDDLDFVVVLGAQVKGKAPSKSLRLRLEKALEIAEKVPQATFILTGGQGEGESISEASCMENYLLVHGVPENRLVLEENATPTWENLSFSDTLTGCGSGHTGVLSNSFHVCRALALARKAGYSDVYGVPASSDYILYPNYVVREICAMIVEGLWWKDP